LGGELNKVALKINLAKPKRGMKMYFICKIIKQRCYDTQMEIAATNIKENRLIKLSLSMS
jgi:hypothetical protein